MLFDNRRFAFYPAKFCRSCDGAVKRADGINEVMGKRLPAGENSAIGDFSYLFLVKLASICDRRQKLIVDIIDEPLSKFFLRLCHFPVG